MAIYERMREKIQQDSQLVQFKQDFFMSFEVGKIKWKGRDNCSMHKGVGLSHSSFREDCRAKIGWVWSRKKLQHAASQSNASGDRSKPHRRAAKPLASLLQLQKELHLVTHLVQFGEFCSKLKLINGLTGRGDSSNLKTA